MDPINRKDHSKNGKKSIPTNGIEKQISTNKLEWPEYITEIDLSYNCLSNVDENVKFPPNLITLNISHNALSEVPGAILNISTLRNLNLSHNKIVIFDDRPQFSPNIEKLNISHNDLIAPPYWVWVDSPPKLTDIDLSFNIKITRAIDKDYLQELCENNTTVCNVKINNCNITKHLALLSTLKKAKVLDIGSDVLSLCTANQIIEVPCEGLSDCCDIERLRLGNTNVYHVLTNIDIFSCLIELNLSQNYISCLPEEFCNLVNLEVCILSMNQLLYLPEGIGKLKKLTSLYVNNNELCMLPESITSLHNLRSLDLYDNCLYEIPSELIKCVPEIDLAQNYCEEPDDHYYLERREKLRLDLHDRYEGRKKDVERPVSSRSSRCTDDEYYSSGSNEEAVPQENERASSPEDWDSDDYWVPIYAKSTKPTSKAYWLCFVKKKMEDGNFCPMDVHQVSIAEKVKYEKLNNPNVVYESEGQFDDYSDDNS